MITAFVGQMGAGKSTAAEYLRAHNFCQLISFAEPLKMLVKKITPDGKIDKVRDRALLQFLGTDYFRGINPNHWIDLYSARVGSSEVLGFNVVTDDARFDNEIDYIKSRPNGKIVWVDGNDTENRLATRDGAVAKGIVGHASEGAIRRDDPRIDFHISNHGTQIEFFDSLDTLIKEISGNQPYAFPL